MVCGRTCGGGVFFALLDIPRKEGEEEGGEERGGGGGLIWL